MAIFAAGDFRAVIWLGNITGMNKVKCWGKVVSVILKEGTLFREEQTEIIVHAQLCDIRFDLRKIRINGRI